VTVERACDAILDLVADGLEPPRTATTDPGRHQLTGTPAQGLTRSPCSPRPRPGQSSPASAARVHARPARDAGRQAGKPLLVVVPTEKDAEALCDDLAAFLGRRRGRALPAVGDPAARAAVPQAATVGQRLRVLDRLRAPRRGPGRCAVVVAPVRALLQPMDPRLAEREPVRLEPGWDGGLDGSSSRSRRARLHPHPDGRAARRVRRARRPRRRVPDRRRPPGPRRVLGRRRRRDPRVRAATSAPSSTVESVTVDAARELVLDAETADTARLLAKQVPALAEQLQLLADGVAFEGMESLVTAIHPAPAYLPDFFPDGQRPGGRRPAPVADRATELREQAAALMIAGWGRGGATDAGGFAQPARPATPRRAGPTRSGSPPGRRHRAGAPGRSGS
jgi:transcription-repair coupling factor (superfamily II helicase)